MTSRNIPQSRFGQVLLVAGVATLIIAVSVAVWAYAPHEDRYYYAQQLDADQVSNETLDWGMVPTDSSEYDTINSLLQDAVQTGYAETDHLRKGKFNALERWLNDQWSAQHDSPAPELAHWDAVYVVKFGVNYYQVNQLVEGPTGAI